MTTPTASVFDQQRFAQAAWDEVTDHAERFLDHQGFPHDRKLAQHIAFQQWLFYTGRLATSFVASEVVKP